MELAVAAAAATAAVVAGFREGAGAGERGGGGGAAAGGGSLRSIGLPVTMSTSGSAAAGAAAWKRGRGGAAVAVAVVVAALATTGEGECGLVNKRDDDAGAPLPSPLSAGVGSVDRREAPLPSSSLVAVGDAADKGRGVSTAALLNCCSRPLPAVGRMGNASSSEGAPRAKSCAAVAALGSRSTVVPLIPLLRSSSAAIAAFKTPSNRLLARGATNTSRPMHSSRAAALSVNSDTSVSADERMVALGVESVIDRLASADLKASYWAASRHDFTAFMYARPWAGPDGGGGGSILRLYHHRTQK